MPTEFGIDQGRDPVVARAVDGFIRGQCPVPAGCLVGCRTDGYDELVDMAGITEIVGDTADTVRHLAQLASDMDSRIGPARLAIVAASGFHYGTGRMYQAQRELQRESTKHVEVFKTGAAAATWLERG